MRENNDFQEKIASFMQFHTLSNISRFLYPFIDCQKNDFKDLNIIPARIRTKKTISAAEYAYCLSILYRQMPSRKGKSEIKIYRRIFYPVRARRARKAITFLHKRTIK